MEISLSPQNQAIIDRYLTGRIYPEIYAFRTGSIPEYVKVGDTYRGVNVRLKEWEAVYANLSEIFRHPALLDGKDENDEKIIFRDHSVHKYLETVLHKHRLTREENPAGLYWSNEFFHDTDADDIRSAIADIQDDYHRSGSKYHYYTLDHIPQEPIPTRDDKELTPRGNQQDAIDRFIAAVGKGYSKLLMYAVMRFGKTFTSLCCAKAIGANKILILTAKPNVEQEWRNAVLTTKNFDSYNKFLTSKSLARDYGMIQRLIEEGENVVVFLSLQDLSGKKTKKKHEQVIATDWDLVIIDETHFGARASCYGEIVSTLDNQQKEDKELQKETKSDSEYESAIEDLEQFTKKLKSKVSLHLSGTPYRILMGHEFTPEQVIASVQYSDILEAKEQWEKEHCEPKIGENETDQVDSFRNPYFGFPKMIRFAFDLGKSALQLIKELQADGYNFTLSMLFKPEKDGKPPYKFLPKFKYEPQVLEFLGAIDGQNQSENILPFLAVERIKQGKLCRHIVMVLPYRASCDAMELLLSQHPEFTNLSEYKILNIAGLNCPTDLNSPEKVVQAIEDCEKSDQKTITLTVNRMLTGSTVPQWDTMIFLKDTQSPEEYDQAIFRLQTPYIKELTSNVDGRTETVKIDMKPQTILVDFSPERVYSLQEQRSLVINATNDKTGNDALQSQIDREVRYSPIITFDHQQLAESSATDIIEHIRKYQAVRSIYDEASYMPVDADIIEDLDIKTFISSLRPLGDKKGLFIRPEEGESDNNPITGTAGTLPAGDTSSSSTSQHDTTSDDNNQDEEKELAKKLKAYYARIFFYALLTNSEVSSLRSLIASINDNDHNRRIARHFGLEIGMLEKIAAACHYQSRNHLDYRIETVNKIWREVKGSPIEKAKFALQKIGRMSESEIVTPESVADEMVALLPDDVFTKGPVLDIASKQGEFALALIKRYGESVGDKIYSVCTSPLAYEFTRKIYEILSLPVNHIFDKFTSYDLIKKDKRKQFIIPQELKPMNFSAIIGNPPYQEVGLTNNKAEAIYPYFYDIAQRLSGFYSLISPARFLFNAGLTPKVWNQKMLNDEHLHVVRYFHNSADVFPNTNINGGVAIMQRNERIKHAPIGMFIPDDTLRSISERFRYGDYQSLSSIVFGGRSDLKFNDNFLSDFPETPKRILSLLQAEHPEISSLGPNEEYELKSSSFTRTPYAFIESEPTDTENYYKILGIERGQRVFKWVLRKYMTPRFPENNNIEAYKVLLSNADGAAGQIGKPIPARIIGKCVVAGPGTSSFPTFMSIGQFATELEAINLSKYIQTKFVRVLLGVLKVTQHITPNTWSYVPMQDFTAGSDIDWSKSVEEIDAQLYAKYNLSDDEIAFIESMIKPM